MAYAEINLTTALQDLGNRLYDPDSVFWSDAEKTRLLYEANRTFGAMANFYREEFDFTTTANVQWYDLTQVTNTLRPYTVTDLDLVLVIQNHFLEPATGFTWTGSLQFATTDLIQALSRRRDQLLSDSGCRITQFLKATNAGRVVLNDTTIDIRRVGWIPNATYSACPLWSGDAWDIKSYERTTAYPIPSIYVRSTQPPLSFTTDVDPPVAGNYDILTVESGPALDGVYATELEIPDDWTWVVKFGAMADLLSRDSQARDPLRAQYCEARYAQGMALLSRSPALLSVKIGDFILDTDSIQNADNFDQGWQARAAGVPLVVLSGGLNMVAMSPNPDNVYTITVTVIENTPLPVDPINDFFQFNEGDYDAVLDYAQHLATLKQGGQEFIATMPLFKNFIEHCRLYNSKLDEVGEYTDIIYKISEMQEQSHPRFHMPVTTEKES